MKIVEVIIIKNNHIIKNIIAILTSVLMIFSLSGCGSLEFDTVKLMSPPDTTGDEAVIQQLISDSASGEPYTLKYPQRGDYGSAVILYDIDNDGLDEAVAFYQINKINETFIHMLVMDQSENQWQVLSNQSVTASEVDQVQFCDTTGDGNKEIIVGYNSYSDNLNQLYDYSVSDQGIVTAQKIDYNYSEMITGDFNSDSVGEIFLISTDTTENTSVAKLLKYDTDKKYTMIGQVNLNQSATSYVQVKYGSIDKNTYGVFIDSIRSGSNYCTEVVYYDNDTKQLKNPLDDKDSITLNPTLRKDDIVSNDVDNDGNIEIPRTINMSDKINIDAIDKNYDIYNLTSWNALNTSTDTLNDKFDSLIDEDNGYYYVVPDDFESNVVVLKNKTDDSVIFEQIQYNTDGTVKKLNDIFTIKVFNKEQWDTYTGTNEYQEIASKGENVYTAKILNSNNEFGINIDNVKEHFEFISY